MFSQALDPVNSIGPEGMPATARQTPVRRVGRPADIAVAYLFLASDEAGYLTGQTIVIDGGRSLAHQ
jgi:3-oxoacyl-[acyl-carrier protein] reductase